MNLVEYYSSDDNTPVELHKTAEADRQLQKRIKINPCPDVHIENSVNLDFLPVQGPANPFVVERNVTRNIMSGHVQEHVINPAVFNALQRSFENHGYTLPPDAPTDNLPTAPQNPKRIRKDKGSVDSPSFMGPWAGFHGQDTALPEDTSEFVPAAPFDKSKINSLNVQESSIFHGKEQFDYLGRSYMHPPSDLDINLLGDGGTQNCFIPKRLAHTWTGHTKGVNCIRWFPKSAHLILSASMDQKIKLWDVYHKRECLRTYIGHSKAIRDVCFGLQGLTFLSASYDRNIKEWDTETGQVKGRFETSKFPFCVTYHPTNPHIFLTGCQDHKIYQFDTRSGKIVNEYVSHHGAVNTITFLDDDRRFASTSDDKSIKCWEFDLPVVVKYVAESDLNSMPAVSRSHDRKSF
jgi:pre-mRNA-processing factor 17